MLQVGWRWTAFLSGVLIIVAGLPLAQLIRHRPEAHGWRVDGDADDAEPAVATARGPTDVNFTAGQAMRTRAFWLISAGHGSALLVVSAVMVHMVVHVTERLGISLAQAAGVVSLITITQIAGQLSGGWAGDRVSKRAIVVGCMVGHAAALLLLAHASAYWMVVVFAMLHGLAWGMRGPLMAAIRADYFGSGSFGMISGISSMVVMLGMIAGPLVAGILADRTGSYVTGFTVLATLAALGSIFFLLARRPDPPAAAQRRVPVPSAAATAPTS
jgi:sugar phosphate permease